MDNNKRNVALQMSTQLHLCLVTAIDTALKDRMGENWYSTFSQYDKSQPKPIINQSQSSVTRWDLQACLKFLRYRSDYAKIVFEYYGHNFFVNNDDARKAQLLLNQLLDNLIHNARNQIFAHASASMVGSGTDDSLRYSVYGVKEAVNDMLRLAEFFKDVKNKDGESYYEKMSKNSFESKFYLIKNVIQDEGLSVSVGEFVDICNQLSIKVSTDKNENMGFSSSNYDGDISRIKLHINQNFTQTESYSVTSTIKKENLKATTGGFVEACQKLQIPVSSDSAGNLLFSTSNYSGDVARIKLALGGKSSKSTGKVILIVAVIAVLLSVIALLAGVLGFSVIKGFSNSKNTEEGKADSGYSQQVDDSAVEDEKIPVETKKPDVYIAGEADYCGATFSIDQKVGNTITINYENGDTEMMVGAYQFPLITVETESDTLTCELTQFISMRKSSNGSFDVVFTELSEADVIESVTIEPIYIQNNGFMSPQGESVTIDIEYYE